MASKEDIFIFGSGFSKAIHPAFPVTSELSKEILDHLEDFQPDDFVRGLIKDDFEHALTYLASNQPWNVTKRLGGQAANRKLVS